MAEVIHDVQQEYWRPPTPRESASATTIIDSVSVRTMADTCARCGTEFMIGSRFCYACGSHRPERNPVASSPALLSTGFLSAKLERLITATADFSRRRLALPPWLRYLHFHEIKRWIGLPTASLIAFFLGLGCVLGALGVSLFYKATTLPEFEAIQMWRMEWLLAATAAFVAGILLKNREANK
jgi:hypothetical protein